MSSLIGIGHEFDRAVWWARAWSWSLHARDCADALDVPGVTKLRAFGCSLSRRQRWRVYKHEKQAWSRLEGLARGGT